VGSPEREFLTSSPWPCPGPTTIPYPLSHAVNDLGANFFFSKYIFDEPPFSNDYNMWLAQSYAEVSRHRVLRAAIEAVGMAGLSNVSYAPRLESKSKQHYGEVLAAVKQALSDPVQATADTTFMAVLLLGLYEVRTPPDRRLRAREPLFLTCTQTVNFKTWDRYRQWAAHVSAAATLLELRGHEQFTRERGVQLYVLIRSQIVSPKLPVMRNSLLSPS
jgi:hypothetical protein